MSINSVKIALITLLSILLTGCTADSSEGLYPTNDAEAKILYETRLAPIINNKCISCHSYHLEGTNRYDTYEKTKSSISQMIDRIYSTSNIAMPPAGAAQLSNEEKGVFSEFYAILNSDPAEIPRVQVTWTAYKFPDLDNRAPVSGTFSEMSYTLNENFTQPSDLLDNAVVSIETNSVKVGNDTEKTENVGMFFSVFTSEIKGTVVSHTSETAMIQFTMNGFEETVPFEVTTETDNLVLTGTIPDMNLFGWLDAYNVLNNVCGEYHENKVWEDIAISIEIALYEN